MLSAAIAHRGATITRGDESEENRPREFIPRPPPDVLATFCIYANRIVDEVIHVDGYFWLRDVVESVCHIIAHEYALVPGDWDNGRVDGLFSMVIPQGSLTNDQHGRCIAAEQTFIARLPQWAALRVRIRIGVLNSEGTCAFEDALSFLPCDIESIGGAVRGTDGRRVYDDTPPDEVFM